MVFEVLGPSCLSVCVLGLCRCGSGRYLAAWGRKAAYIAGESPGVWRAGRGYETGTLSSVPRVSERRRSRTEISTGGCVTSAQKPSRVSVSPLSLGTLLP